MKIGIDLDGVVFDSEKIFRTYAELFDLLELKRNSVKNPKEPRAQLRYNWTREEFLQFYNEKHDNILDEAKLIPGVKQVLHMLKEDGHELVVITAREEESEKILKRIKDNDIEVFQQYFWNAESKEEICKKTNIDLMIDDYYKICQSTSENNIKTIYLQDGGLQDLEENENLKVLYNWGEIYRYIKQLEK